MAPDTGQATREYRLTLRCEIGRRAKLNTINCYFESYLGNAGLAHEALR